MYEIIASAIAVGASSVAIIKKFGLSVRYSVGGTIFGLGWALVGACPGPLFALLGNGITVMLAAIASAMLGTWLHAVLKPRLPH